MCVAYKCDNEPYDSGPLMMCINGIRNPSESKMRLLPGESSRSGGVLRPAISIGSIAESEAKTGRESVFIK